MNKVLSDIAQLSAGTISRLAGTRLYSEIDAYRDDFYNWAVQQEKNGIIYESWQDAYNLFRWKGDDARISAS